MRKCLAQRNKKGDATCCNRKYENKRGCDVKGRIIDSRDRVEDEAKRPHIANVWWAGPKLRPTKYVCHLTMFFSEKYLLLISKLYSTKRAHKNMCEC